MIQTKKSLRFVGDLMVTRRLGDALKNLEVNVGSQEWVNAWVTETVKKWLLCHKKGEKLG